MSNAHPERFRQDVEVINIKFYESLAPKYDLFFRDFEKSMRDEGEWLRGLVGDTPRDILDACCGTGRQAIPLAQGGHRVVASDPCGAMRLEAERLASSQSVILNFKSYSFAELGDHFTARFDWVVALGNGLCHLVTPDAIQSALSSMRACLRTSGQCLIGIKDFERIRRLRRRFHPRSRYQYEGSNHLLFDVWTFEDPILISTSYVMDVEDVSNRRELASTREYMLEASELMRLAQEVGFTDIRRLPIRSEAVFQLS